MLPRLSAAHWLAEGLPPACPCCCFVPHPYPTQEFADEGVSGSDEEESGSDEEEEEQTAVNAAAVAAVATREQKQAADKKRKAEALPAKEAPAKVAKPEAALRQQQQQQAKAEKKQAQQAAPQQKDKSGKPKVREFPNGFVIEELKQVGGASPAGSSGREGEPGAGRAPPRCLPVQPADPCPTWSSTPA